MVADDYPEYRVFWSRSEFRGSDVCEIFPGDFSGETRWQNAGSRYVREEAFALFNDILLAIARRFDGTEKPASAGALYNDAVAHIRQRKCVVAV